MRRRKNLFLTIWLSYLLVLIIPMTISAFLFSNIKNNMVESANRSNLAMLEQVRHVVDSQMQELDSLINQIATNSRIQTLWNIDDGERYLQYSEAVATLKNIRSGSGFVDDFYIHFRNSDIIITPSLKTDSATYFSKINPYGDYSVDEIKQHLLSNYHYKTFWPSEANRDSADRVIASATTFPLGDISNVRATLVLLIEESEIFNLLKQIEWANSSSIYILDNTGQVLVSTAGDLMLPAGLPIEETQSGYHSFRLNNEDMMLSYTNGANGWQYVSLIPKNVVLEPIHQTTTTVVILLIIAVLLGTAVAYWMANRSYGPIRKMVNVLMNNSDSPAAKDINEYEFIHSSIVQTLAEREQMKETLANHAPLLLAHFLTRLLNDQTTRIDQDTTDFMGLKLSYRYNCVVLVTCDDSSQFREGDSEQEWALVRFILYNLGSELIKETGYVLETGTNQLAILLNVADSLEDADRIRDAMIAKLKQIAEERFRMKLSFGTSSYHQEIEGFGKAYREATSALDYRIIHGTGSITHYDQIKDMEQSYNYHYPLDVEIRLINYLKSGNYEQAKSLLDELYKHNMASKDMTSEMGKFLILDLLSTILKVINALKIDDNQLLQGIDPIRDIMDEITVHEMLTKIKDLCRLICRSVREARTDKGDLLNEQIKGYIQSHILDNGLSLTSIADHFGMAPQYISGFFKKHNNMNLTEYILEIRIREAKKLLDESDLTMLQIAQKIGYANDIGFIRVFKKQEGITPGKYREMIRATNNN